MYIRVYVRVCNNYIHEMTKKERKRELFTQEEFYCFYLKRKTFAKISYA